MITLNHAASLQQAISDAIAESVLTGEIVKAEIVGGKRFADLAESAIDELAEVAGDSTAQIVGNWRICEFWGRTDERQDWRVHLHIRIE